MNRIKTLIAAVALIMYLASLNVFAVKGLGENETPMLPLFPSEPDDEVSDNDKPNPSPTTPPDSDSGSDNNSENETPMHPALPSEPDDEVVDNDKPNPSPTTPPDSDSGSDNNSENETPMHPALPSEPDDEVADNDKPAPSPITPPDSGENTDNPNLPSTTPDDSVDVNQDMSQTENIVNPFADIKQDAWYYSDIMFVFSNKIMVGTSESEFSPETTLNRAMMITIIHRIDGNTVNFPKAVFNDVENNSWYEDAVNWGYANKIINGTSENTFSPMDNLTREQLCVMLYNYTKHIGNKTEFADISAYSDNNAVSDWAKEAISWAVQEKIIMGKGNDTLAPKDSATRAEAAAIIRRYTEKFIEKSR